MAGKKARYYEIDNENRQIVIDPTVNPTADDLNMLKAYGVMGYTVRPKSLARAAEMRRRAASKWSDEEILAVLGKEEDKTLLNEYNKIKKTKPDKAAGIKGGFFAARAYFETEWLDKHKGAKKPVLEKAKEEKPKEEKKK